MRNPIDVLNSLKSKVKIPTYHYERLYRNLYNSEFFLQAYYNIYAKPGNMTPGTDGQIIDGMGILLYVLREKWQKKLLNYSALKITYKEGREIFIPTERTYLINSDDLEILNQYNTEIRGIYNYYRITDNVSVLGDFLLHYEIQFVQDLRCQIQDTHQPNPKKVWI